MNGLHARDYTSEDADSLCQDLIKDSEVEFVYTSTTAVHRNALLTKHFYVHSRGRRVTESSFTSETMDCAASGAEARKVVELTLADAGQDLDEPPDAGQEKQYKDLLARQAVLRSAKVQLEKSQSSALDLHAQMEAAPNSAIVEEKLIEVQTACDVVAAFLKELRVHGLRCDKVQASSCTEVLDLVAASTKYADAATCHLDAFKAMQKRVKATIT